MLAGHLGHSNHEVGVFNSQKTLEGGDQKGHLGHLDRHWLDKVERVLSETVLKGKGVQEAGSALGRQYYSYRSRLFPMC